VEILIVGSIEIEPERRAALLEAVRPYVEATRADEPGCLDYTVCGDPEHPGRVMVFERWAGQDDLVEHFKQPHIAAFREAIEPYPRSGRSMRRYFVARAEEFQSSSVTAS